MNVHAAYPDIERESDSLAAGRSPRSWPDRLLRYEIHRLKVMRRSWMRSPGDRDVARRIRRWMRDPLRELKRRERVMPLEISK